jgi:hypothetical protein
MVNFMRHAAVTGVVAAILSVVLVKTGAERAFELLIAGTLFGGHAPHSPSILFVFWIGWAIAFITWRR